MAVVTSIYKTHYFQQNFLGLLFQVKSLNITQNTFTLQK